MSPFLVLRKAASFVLLLCLLLPSAFAQTKAYTVQGKDFSVPSPADWKQVLPNENNFVLQGPASSEGNRPVLFVTHVGLTGTSFDEALLRQQYPNYQAKRAEYLNGKGARILGWEPFTSGGQGKDGRYFAAGVNYEMGSEVYHERSRFVSCGGSVFQVKSLDFKTTKTQGSAASLAEKFQCAR